MPTTPTCSSPIAETPAAPRPIDTRPRSPLLIQEPPLLVLPSLAQAVGLNEAIVLQQLHYLLDNPANGRWIDGRQWIFNTFGQWIQDYFPFWCERTLRGVFQSLVARGYVLTCQPEGRVSRRKYYTLSSEAVGQLPDAANLAGSMRQDLPDGKRQMLPDGKRQSLPLPSTKTSAETTSKTSVQRVRKKERAPAARATSSIPEAKEETEPLPKAATQPSPPPTPPPIRTAEASTPQNPPPPPPETLPVKPTDQEWDQFMSERHPELMPNPGWDWCQPLHAECRAWLQQS